MGRRPELHLQGPIQGQPWEQGLRRIILPLGQDLAAVGVPDGEQISLRPLRLRPGQGQAAGLLADDNVPLPQNGAGTRDEKEQEQHGGGQHRRQRQQERQPALIAYQIHGDRFLRKRRGGGRYTARPRLAAVDLYRQVRGGSDQNTA